MCFNDEHFCEPEHLRITIIHLEGIAKTKACRKRRELLEFGLRLFEHRVLEQRTESEVQIDLNPEFTQKVNSSTFKNIFWGK